MCLAEQPQHIAVLEIELLEPFLEAVDLPGGEAGEDLLSVFGEEVAHREDVAAEKLGEFANAAVKSKRLLSGDDYKPAEDANAIKRDAFGRRVR